MPFEVPSSWEWCRLEEIMDFINGRAYKKEELLLSGKYRVLRVGNFFTNNSWYYSDLELPDDKYCNNGDLLYAWSASFGPKIWDGEKTIFHYHIWNVKYNQSVIKRDYLFYFLLEDKNQISRSTTGSTMVHVSMENMNPRFIPLPPLAEQQRIVTEIKHWFTLIDQIEQGKADLQTTIKQAKRKILDLAIHGKLVPQDPNDEPALELLKRINPDAEITCDNGQYGKMPEGWCETILGELFEHNTGKALNSSNQEGVMRDYLTTSNVYWDTFDLSVVKQMLFKENELEKCTVVKGDLLVCEGGDVGRSAIWNLDYDICIQNHLHRLRPKAELSVRFYYHVLKYLKDNNMIGGKGIGLLGLSSKELHKLPFPLPPYNEQQRIVTKIEELFISLDNIQKALEV